MPRHALHRSALTQLHGNPVFSMHPEQFKSVQPQTRQLRTSGDDCTGIATFGVLPLGIRLTDIGLPTMRSKRAS